MDQQKLFDLLQRRFSEDKVISLDTENSDPAKITVHPAALHEISKYLAEDHDDRFDSLMCLSGDDLGKDLAVLLHLHSMKADIKLTLQAICDRTEPIVDSVTDIWATANWHEREAYDMYGIVFNGHPNMRRMFLPEDWEGFPLRKDYVAAEYWHGMPIAKELTVKMK